MHIHAKNNTTAAASVQLSQTTLPNHQKPNLRRLKTCPRMLAAFVSVHPFCTAGICTARMLNKECPNARLEQNGGTAATVHG
jgi:hypothetical protein